MKKLLFAALLLSMSCGQAPEAESTGNAAVSNWEEVGDLSIRRFQVDGHRCILVERSGKYGSSISCDWDSPIQEP